MARKNGKTLRVIELFAGVGGFRVGFERASSVYDTVWFNQWEPGKSDKAQHAWATYCKAFELNPLESRLAHTNTDIHKVPVSAIPDHDLLVGGFPCQDYSVARVLSQAAGLEGRKGVLWWDIHRILSEKGKKAPNYLMLENVDRLLKSPVSQRGRDFAVMLSTLNERGYAVEWRVINAADYGMPQRRRRVYILGYKKGTAEYSALKKDPVLWLLKEGIMPSAFPIEDGNMVRVDPAIDLDAPEKVSKEFNKNGGKTPFENAGVMIGGKVYTVATKPVTEKLMPLRKVLEPEYRVKPEFYIPRIQLKAWRELKGGKKETRTTKGGFSYEYSEGPVAFPDHLDKPSRTIVTGEGGSTPSRFKHVVEVIPGKPRRLMPVELERLNMFDTSHTEGASDTTRAFFMGNALVVGIVTRLGKELARRIDG